LLLSYCIQEYPGHEEEIKKIADAVANEAEVEMGGVYDI
jgi:hypothetical protein